MKFGPDPPAQSHPRWSQCTSEKRKKERKHEKHEMETERKGNLFTWSTRDVGCSRMLWRQFPLLFSLHKSLSKPFCNYSLSLKMPLWMHWQVLHKLLRVWLRKCSWSLSLLWALQIKFYSVLSWWAGGRNQSVMEISEPDPINPKWSAGVWKSWGKRAACTSC